MNKVKIVATLVLIMLIVSVTLSVQAITKDELITYVTSKHTVLGREYQLDSSQIAAVTNHLNSITLSDAEATAIRDELAQAIKLLNDTGASDLSKVSASTKAQVTSIIHSAAAKADLKVSINTSTRVITVTNTNGVHILSASYNVGFSPVGSGGVPYDGGGSSGKLVYTGASTLLINMSVLAIIAVATVLVVRRKV